MPTRARPKDNQVQWTEVVLERVFDSEEFLDSAPDSLISLVKHPTPFMGKGLLYRLLTDSHMAPAWKEIEKRISKKMKTGQEDEIAQNVQRHNWYRWLWSEIHDAFIRSKSKPPSRIKKRDQFQRIASAARKVADQIENGPLDRLLFEFFPPGSATLAFNMAEWSKLTGDEKMDCARHKLRHWPSLIDVLHEVAIHAERIAIEAMTEPLVVERDTADRETNYFIRRLSRYFRNNLGGPMHGTVARIATVALSKKVDEDFVKRFLSHTKI